MSKVCRFYVKGQCKFGSSCRFSHSDHSNEQYHEENRPRKHANRDYSDSRSNDDGSYDHYKQSNYEPDVSYHSKKKINSKNNYNQKNAYNYNNENYNEDKYHSNKNPNEDNYHSYKTRNEDNYHSNYNSNDNYHYSKQKENNVKNYYKEYDNAKDDNINSNYNNDKKHFKDNNVNNGEHFANFNRNSKDCFGYQNGNVQERETKLKFYDKELKSYVSHINQLNRNNVWPLTCFQPIGSSYAIQPVGSLNLIEVSFEEIRCDYYSIKNIVPDPISIHKHCMDELLFKAKRMKEDIVTLADHVQTDMLETFDKCEQSKMNNPSFQNSIQADPNSYWDMSQRYLKNSLTVKSEIDTFSFAIDQEKTKHEPSLKILMQVETYGQADNEAYAQENFTDFIPIMPPPRKYCL